MPTRQKHRGRHPKDLALFSESKIHQLYAAAADLAWLLDRDYSERASARLVGDRYKLTARQRKALLRITCPAGMVERIRNAEVGVAQLLNASVAIDALNILIFSETLLSGGILFETMDGVFRDIASVHGSYHRVKETPAAIRLVADLLQGFQVKHADWYVDAPVSNSGRLAGEMHAYAAEHGLPWHMHVVHNPDSVLSASGGIILSSDRMVLCAAKHWFNISRALVESVDEGSMELRRIPDLLKKVF